MLKEPRIAILIVNWCQAEHTINCTASLLKQPYPNYRIFLIDNHSPDNSFDKLTKTFRGNQKVKVLKTFKNLGYAGGNNFAAQFAMKEYRPDYLCLLNNDTLIESDILTKFLDAANRYGESNLYFPLILKDQSKTIQSAGLTDYLPTPFQFKYRGKTVKKLSREEESKYLSGCCFLIKSRIYSQLGGFVENYFMYGEDIDLSFRLKKLNLKFYLVPQALISHKGASELTPLSIYYTTRNTFYLIQRYFGNKKKETWRALFWLTLLTVKYCLPNHPEILFAYVKGLGAFLKKDQGQANFPY